MRTEEENNSKAFENNQIKNYGNFYFILYELEIGLSSVPFDFRNIHLGP